MSKRDTIINSTVDEAKKLEAKQGLDLQKLEANLNRLPEAVGEYLYLKRHIGDVIEEMRQKVIAEVPDNEEEQRRIFKQEWELHGKEWEKQLSGVRNSLDAAFTEGAYLFPDMVKPSDDQQLKIRAGEPIILTEEQAKHIMIKETDDLDERVAIVTDQMSPEQAKRYNTLRVEPQWNPFQDANWLERQAGKIDPVAQGAYAVPLVLSRELQKLAPVPTPRLLTKDQGDLTLLARRVVRGAKKLPAALIPGGAGPLLAETADIFLRPTVGTDVPKAIAAADPFELVPQVVEGVKQRAFNPRAISTEQVVSPARNRYADAALKYAEEDVGDTMAEAVKAEKDALEDNQPGFSTDQIKQDGGLAALARSWAFVPPHGPRQTPRIDAIRERADKHYQAYLQNESTIGETALEYPNWVELGMESALSLYNVAGPARILRFAGKAATKVADVGVAAGAKGAAALGVKAAEDIGTAAELVKKAADTRAGRVVADSKNKAVDWVKESRAGQLYQTTKEAFTHAPERTRFERIGEAQEAAMTSYLADEARMTTASEKTAQENIRTLKTIRAAEKRAKKLGIDFWAAAESTAKPPVEIADGIAAVRNLADDMMAAQRKSGLHREFATFNSPGALQRFLDVDAKVAAEAYEILKTSRKFTAYQDAMKTASLGTVKTVTALERIAEALPEVGKTFSDPEAIKKALPKMRISKKTAQEAADIWKVRKLTAQREAFLKASPEARGAYRSARKLEGTLQPLPTHEGYVPHILDEPPPRLPGESYVQWKKRIWQEGNAAKVEATGGAQLRRADLRASGSYARTGETIPLRDVYRQFRAKLIDEMPKTLAADKLRTLTETLGSGRMLHHVSAEGAEKALLTLQKVQPELEWVAMRAPGQRLDPLLRHTAASNIAGFEETFQRIVMPTGTKKGEFVTLLPREMFETVASMLPIIAPQELTKLQRWVNTAGSVVTPYMQVYRAAKTITRYAFALRNIQSVFGIDYMARGLGALELRNAGLAAVGSFAHALGDKSKILEYAEKLPFTLRNGERKTLGWALKQADSLGIIDGLNIKLALETGMEGNPVLRMIQKGAEFDVKGARMLKAFSPGYWAKATENMQHLTSFMGFLEGSSKQAVDRAFRLATKETGYARHMGAVEKGLFRNAFTFYGWQRFILPRMARALWEHPERVAAYARAMRLEEQLQNRKYTFGPEGESPQSMYGVHRGLLKSRIPELDSDEFTIAVRDNPLIAGYAFYPAFARALKLRGDIEGPKLYTMLGPILQAALRLFDEHDLETGGRLGDAYDEYRPKTWLSYVPIPLADLGESTFAQARDLYRLYSRDALHYDKAAGIQLRYTAGRIIGGLDNRLARIFGFEPRSMGGMFDWQTGGRLFEQQYVVNPIAEMVRRQKAAIDRIPIIQSENRKLDLERFDQ